MKKCQLLYFFTLVIGLSLISCDSQKRNTLDLGEKPVEIKNSLIEVNDLILTLNDTVRLMIWSNNRLSINQGPLWELDSLTRREIPGINQLSEIEWLQLKQHLRRLDKNGISGCNVTNFGFTRFFYKELKSTESYEDRYLAIDSKDLQLERRGFRVLDKRQGIVLFTFK